MDYKTWTILGASGPNHLPPCGPIFKSRETRQVFGGAAARARAQGKCLGRTAARAHARRKSVKSFQVEGNASSLWQRGGESAGARQVSRQNGSKNTHAKGKCLRQRGSNNNTNTNTNTKRKAVCPRLTEEVHAFSSSNDGVSLPGDRQVSSAAASEEWRERRAMCNRHGGR